MILPTMFAVCFSLLAVCIATGALIATSRTSAASHWKRLSVCSERIELLEGSHERLSAELKNMRAARNMSAMRERMRQVESDMQGKPADELDDDSKARLREQLNASLATGAVSALKPGV